MSIPRPGAWAYAQNPGILKARLLQIQNKVSSDDFKHLMAVMDCKDGTKIIALWESEIWPVLLHRMTSEHDGHLLASIDRAMMEMFANDEFVLRSWKCLRQILHLTSSSDDFLERRKEILGKGKPQASVPVKAVMICDILAVCILSSKARIEAHGNANDGFLGAHKINVVQPEFQHMLKKVRKIAEAVAWSPRDDPSEKAYLKRIYESFNVCFRLRCVKQAPNLKGRMSGTVFIYNNQEHRLDRTQAGWKEKQDRDAAASRRTAAPTAAKTGPPTPAKCAHATMDASGAKRARGGQANIAAPTHAVNHLPVYASSDSTPSPDKMSDDLKNKRRRDSASTSADAPPPKRLQDAKIKDAAMNTSSKKTPTMNGTKAIPSKDSAASDELASSAGEDEEAFIASRIADDAYRNRFGAAKWTGGKYRREAAEAKECMEKPHDDDDDDDDDSTNYNIDDNRDQTVATGECVAKRGVELWRLLCRCGAEATGTAAALAQMPCRECGALCCGVTEVALAASGGASHAGAAAMHAEAAAMEEEEEEEERRGEGDAACAGMGEGEGDEMMVEAADAAVRAAGEGEPPLLRGGEAGSLSRKVAAAEARSTARDAGSSGEEGGAGIGAWGAGEVETEVEMEVVCRGLAAGAAVVDDGDRAAAAEAVRRLADVGGAQLALYALLQQAEAGGAGAEEEEGEARDVEGAGSGEEGGAAGVGVGMLYPGVVREAAGGTARPLLGGAEFSAALVRYVAGHVEGQGGCAAGESSGALHVEPLVDAVVVPTARTGIFRS